MASSVEATASPHLVRWDEESVSLHRLPEGRSGGQINGTENTLKHTAGHYGPGHMASGGKIIRVTKQEGKIPLGSSGVQVHFETGLVIEAIRPGRVVRIRPNSWPKSQIPREEYLFNNSPENRFPTPAIFPKY